MLYSFKEIGKIDINNKILQFNIRLKDATSKQKKFLFINGFELKILIGTVIIKKNRIKLNNIWKSSAIFTRYKNSYQFYLLYENLLKDIYLQKLLLFVNLRFYKFFYFLF